MTFTRSIRTRLRPALRSNDGAIDLASIMVGVLVIGIVGGVIAAAVFGVVPWSQDHAAQQDLDAVKTAQSVALVKDGAFQSSAGLESAKYLPASGHVKVTASADGTCYVAVSKSPTGAIYYTTNTMPAPKKWTTGATTDCEGKVKLDDVIDTLPADGAEPGGDAGNGDGGNGDGGNGDGGNGQPQQPTGPQNPAAAGEVISAVTITPRGDSGTTSWSVGGYDTVTQSAKQNAWAQYLIEKGIAIPVTRGASYESYGPMDFSDPENSLIPAGTKAYTLPLASRKYVNIANENQVLTLPGNRARLSMITSSDSKTLLGWISYIDGDIFSDGTWSAVFPQPISGAYSTFTTTTGQIVEARPLQQG